MSYIRQGTGGMLAKAWLAEGRKIKRSNFIRTETKSAGDQISMGSSNRHWTSFFKSKPRQQQEQRHDMIPSRNTCAWGFSPDNSASGLSEERSPEPKARWNPKAEQISILEEIFNSGMVNPPRDEIRRITAQLQQYGQVGDANVFYWFQNRKSRSKQKQRHRLRQPAATGSTSTRSPLQRSPPNLAAAATHDVSTSTSTTAASTIPVLDQYVYTAGYGSADMFSDQIVGNGYMIDQQEPSFFPGMISTGQGLMGFDELMTSSTTTMISSNINVFQNQDDVGDQIMMMSTAAAGSGLESMSDNLLLGDMIGSGTNWRVEDDDREVETKQQQDNQQLSSIHLQPNPGSYANYDFVAVDSTLSPTSDLPWSGSLPCPSGRTTVFINDVAYEVPLGRFNVRDAFGDDALLVLPSGHPVATDEWGVTLHPLQNGALYYVTRTPAAGADGDRLLFDRHAVDSFDLLAPYFPLLI